MIVEFKLNSQDPSDLLVLNHLFTTLKIDVTPAPSTETPPAEAPPKKKGRGKAKAKTEGPSETEIKEMDFDQMSSHLLHKEDDPSEFEVKWFAKLFKKKHGGQDEIRTIINDLGAHNFTDLKKKDFKKFSTLLAEKDAALTGDNEEPSGDEDLDI